MKPKKWLWALLGAAVIVILCVVIFRKPVYREPPDLLVRSEAEEITVSGSATSWKYRKSGDWSEYESGLKPVDPRGVHPQLGGLTKTVTLEFTIEPDRFRVSRYWNLRAETEEDGIGVSRLRLNGNELELTTGDCLYEVIANWSPKDRNWGGSAVYYFRATASRIYSGPIVFVTPQ